MLISNFDFAPKAWNVEAIYVCMWLASDNIGSNHICLVKGYFRTSKKGLLLSSGSQLFKGLVASSLYHFSFLYRV